jgi:hypothetical protein
MTGSIEPEREMVRRTVPYGPPAIALALVAGLLADGWGTAWSAAIGVAVVFVNFTVNGLTLSRAARISLTAYAAAAMVGFAVRLGAILALMFLLNHFSFFSPLSFGLAVLSATTVLLVFEMRLWASGLGRDLRLDEAGQPLPLIHHEAGR